MKSFKSKFWKIFLPYCIQRQNNGTYVLLNRKYKPLGFHTDEWVNYSDYPIAFKARITPQLASKISFNGNQDVDNIYLYNDACTFGRSNNNAQVKYFYRLALLLHIVITAEF